MEMLDTAKKINTLSFESITKMQDPNKSKHNRFITLLTALNDFPDDRTGEKFGPVNEWGPSKALVIDGLTGINNAAMALVIGGKPVRNPGDWGLAQDQVYKILKLLCDDCPMHFILIGHVERETDAVLGGVKIMISTLGKALAPMLPVMFSDVILTVRNSSTWTWDTASAMADVKTRNLPIAATNQPTFATIIAKWKARGGTI